MSPLSDNEISDCQVLLVTLNARYHHTAFGLRCLFSNLEELQAKTKILEFVINQNPRDIVENILSHNPKIVGFGVYIWNTRHTQDVVSLLKRLRPELIIILGGPEVSHESEDQFICGLADFVIRGEADLLFRDQCRRILADDSTGPKFISGPLPDLNLLKSPYDLYSESDLKHRTLYVEASRGCPYKCEYCLSSLDTSVRSFPLDMFLIEMEKLIQRGGRHFKFLDRTFNLGLTTSLRVLEFFLKRIDLGVFLHFELVPDRLPNELKDTIRKFPAGSLQFEIGIQTWNPEVARLVSRRQDYQKIRENLTFLAHETGAHLHVDLIGGLPGEDILSFARGFDEVAALSPHEIQVGLLKRLKGTPISRHEKTFSLIYQDHPPFQIISTSTMDYLTLQRLDRFSSYWDRFSNSGQFVAFMKTLRNAAAMRVPPSLFSVFDDFREFLERRHATSHSISLAKLTESAFVFLTENLGLAQDRATEVLRNDYSMVGGRDLPDFLRSKSESTQNIPKRQKRHLNSTRAGNAD